MKTIILLLSFLVTLSRAATDVYIRLRDVQGEATNPCRADGDDDNEGGWIHVRSFQFEADPQAVNNPRSTEMNQEAFDIECTNGNNNNWDEFDLLRNRGGQQQQQKSRVFSISKGIDISSPQLNQYAINGRYYLGSAEINFVETGGDAEAPPTCSLRYKLDGVLFEKWSIKSGDTADDNNRLVEEATFSYRKIAFTYNLDDNKTENTGYTGWDNICNEPWPQEETSKA